MDLTRQVFAYCERAGLPEFWAEPLNAVTNAAFLIAALAAYRLRETMPSERRGLMELAMMAIVAIIGLGSFLFHTFATVWAALADTIPIGVFMMVYMGFALRSLIGWPWWAVVLGLVAFFASLAAASVYGGAAFNGSVAYFPAFAAMVGIGGYLMSVSHPAGRYLLAAGLIFAVSLTFRSLDLQLCTSTLIGERNPLGLHFMWHILNATLLYLLMVAAIRHGTLDEGAGRVAAA